MQRFTLLKDVEIREISIFLRMLLNRVTIDEIENKKVDCNKNLLERYINDLEQQVK